MMETKRLQNSPLRDARILAVYNSVDALAERFVADAPGKRFEQKRAELEGKLVPFHSFGRVARVVSILYLITYSQIQEPTFQNLDLSYLICD